MAEPIRKLGPYTLVSRIGVGGFGVVWLAEKRTAIATTQFALKLPRGDDIDLEAFKQEAAIWIQASGHPNVLPLIDADIYDGQVVIVSEYVSDGSLAGWLKQHGGKAPTAEAACEIMDGVLAGLAHLHARHIIHRDLKPENILLQRETPRLADFGIARLLKSSSHSANISGTLAYMAPEAFDGKRNEQTDAWSVGVIFYELLAGRLPYDQPDIPSFIGAIMRHDPPPLPDSVPEVLRQIVIKALQRDPANRYSSAVEMRRDLREAEHQLWLGGRKTFVEAEKQTIPPAVTQPNLPQPITPRPIAPPPAVRPAPAKTEPIIVPAKPTLPSETLPLPIAEKGKSHRPFGLAAQGALVIGLLSVLFAVFYWGPSRIANRRQTSTPTAAKPSAALMLTLAGHNDSVYSIAFSPDGKSLASGSRDKIVKLWDAQTGALKHTFYGHKYSVNEIAFSPDGKTIASGSEDNTVKLWDVETRVLNQTLAGQIDQVLSVVFSPDGRILVTGNRDRTVKLWEVQTGTLKQTLTGHSSIIWSVAFAPDGQTVASASADGTVKLWDAQTGVLRRTFTENDDQVMSVTFSPDGKTLAIGSKSIKLWDTQTWLLKQTFIGNSDWVYSIRFSPDGNTVTSASTDEQIGLWDVQDGRLKQTFTGHVGSVRSVAFSPDGKTLASSGDDKTVKVWRVE